MTIGSNCTALVLQSCTHLCEGSKTGRRFINILDLKHDMVGKKPNVINPHMARPLTPTCHLLSCRWEGGGAWHVRGVLPRSQGSHGFVPWQGLWNWGARFPPSSPWGWLSAWSPSCCLSRHGMIWKVNLYSWLSNSEVCVSWCSFICSLSNNIYCIPVLFSGKQWVNRKQNSPCLNEIHWLVELPASKTRNLMRCHRSQEVHLCLTWEAIGMSINACLLWASKLS